MKNIFKLGFTIILCQSIGILGSLVTMPSIQNWYLALNKPFFNPPNWIFGPVWTLLYLMMGVALFLVWTKKGKIKKTNAYLVFFLQLLVNFMWSYVFFYLHLPLLAFIVILLLWVLILINIILFQKIAKPAAYLLIPYIFWVTFASLLNLYIVLLNN